MGRELLKGSEELHLIFVHHPKNLLALEGKMRISSADLERGEEGKAYKPLLYLVFICNREAVENPKQSAFPLYVTLFLTISL